MLQGLYRELVKQGAKGKTIAHLYNISEAEVSHLRAELEEMIDEPRLPGGSPPARRGGRGR